MYHIACTPDRDHIPIRTSSLSRGFFGDRLLCDPLCFLVFLPPLYHARSFFGFVGIAIFPFDIGLAKEGDPASKGLVGLWTVVYWVTFVLSWIVLPLVMDYWASGEFSKRSDFALGCKR